MVFYLPTIPKAALCTNFTAMSTLYAIGFGTRGIKRFKYIKLMEGKQNEPT